MKRILLTLALAGTGLLVAPSAVQAQEKKPELNTAPPGTVPRPATQPAPRPAVPVPPPTDEPLPAPTAKPTPNSPSGLEFPKGTSAAEQPKPQYKYFLYSNFGLNYNGDSYYGSQFNVSAAPAIGYRVNDRFAFGPGISYSYLNYGLPNDAVARGFPKNIKTNSIGIKAFAQYIVYKEFFVHAEYEVTYAEVLPNQVILGGPYTKKMTVRTPLLGAGYRQQLGDRFAADITVLYNFNDGLYDIYGQPVIRFSLLYNLGK